MPRVSPVTRAPIHAGSWYDGDGESLASRLEGWLASSSEPEEGPAKALIAPHAGHRYCGHVMAAAYKGVDVSRVCELLQALLPFRVPQAQSVSQVGARRSRIFLLGPSHHVYMQKCALSRATHYATPLGDMAIDQQVYAELGASGYFEAMDMAADEAEHSLELQLPYLVHIMRGRQVTLIPILVGALSPRSEAKYGELLAPYFDAPGTLFVISSDFCHWGSRFNYTFYDKSKGQIHESIRWLDRIAMDIIEEGDPLSFTQYLRRYSNTICGRHPIAVLLNVLRRSRLGMRARFLRYEQSSQCMTMQDSSVSYAAAIIS